MHACNAQWVNIQVHTLGKIHDARCQHSIRAPTAHERSVFEPLEAFFQLQASILSHLKRFGLICVGYSFFFVLLFFAKPQGGAVQLSAAAYTNTPPPVFQSPPTHFYVTYFFFIYSDFCTFPNACKMKCDPALIFRPGTIRPADLFPISVHYNSFQNALVFIYQRKGRFEFPLLCKVRCPAVQEQRSAPQLILARKYCNGGKI